MVAHLSSKADSFPSMKHFQAGSSQLSANPKKKNPSFNNKVSKAHARTLAQSEVTIKT
jgi:hypothetical protein